MSSSDTPILVAREEIAKHLARERTPSGVVDGSREGGRQAALIERRDHAAVDQGDFPGRALVGDPDHAE
jgi:hypothetical protein